MRRQFVTVVTLLIAFSGLAAHYQWLKWNWFVVFVALALVGVYDMFQRKHAILRNFPVVGHLRFLLELFRPEIQQYFIESDDMAAPLARIYRTVVYERSKGELETVPFGSQLNLYAPEYMWVNHSAFPVHI